MKTSSITILFLLVFLFSCQYLQKETKKQEPDPNKPTIHKTYYKKSGALKSEITIKNNKKNGPAKKYYPTGELHTLVNYVDNIKEGETIWYYKNGQPYRVTQYINGKMDGLRKIYYENGKLQAEIPYENGELIEGTKEYNKNGNLITKTPKIKFKEHDLMKFENKFILKVYLSNKSKRVKFFEEKTTTAGNKVRLPLTTKGGTAELEYIMPPGAFQMKTIKVYAEYKSKLGNLILLSANYNLAIENK